MDLNKNDYTPITNSQQLMLQFGKKKKKKL